MANNKKNQNSFSIAPGVNVPQEVIEFLNQLASEGRLVKNFLIVGHEAERLTRSGQPEHRLRIIPAGGTLIWGGFRKRLESQLEEAGVLAPQWNPDQQTAWGALCGILIPYFDALEVSEIQKSECRSAGLLGLLDQMAENGDLSPLGYVRARGLVDQLGPDRFGLDFDWYFGEKPPDDHYRGLE